MSKEDIMEENPLNPEEGKTTDAPQGDGQEPNSDGKEYTENEKRQYARAKKAEEELKRLREELKKVTKEPDEEPKEEHKKELSVFELAKEVKILSEYSEKELEIISDFAKARGVSEAKAAQSEDVKAIISAVRDKIKNENLTPKPSTKQDLSQKTADEIIKKGGIGNLDIDSKAELINKYNEEKKARNKF